MTQLFQRLDINEVLDGKRSAIVELVYLNWTWLESDFGR
jgi:hypothetical protein